MSIFENFITEPTKPLIGLFVLIQIFNSMFYNLSSPPFTLLVAAALYGLPAALPFKIELKQENTQNIVFILLAIQGVFLTEKLWFERDDELEDSKTGTPNWTLALVIIFILTFGVLYFYSKEGESKMKLSMKFLGMAFFAVAPPLILDFLFFTRSLGVDKDWTPTSGGGAIVTLCTIVFLFASFIASKIFLLFPEVVIEIKTSPFPPKPSICLEKIFSKPKSFDMQVIVAGSLGKAIDFKGILFFLNLPISSAERCILSDALPPFPHQHIFFPFDNA